MGEAAVCQSPNKLRELFAIILVFCQISDALCLWNKYKESLSEDILYEIKLFGDLNIDSDTLDRIYNKCLIRIEDIVLSIGGECLKNYGLPVPNRSEESVRNMEYLREISYENNEIIVSNNESLLTVEQNEVFKKILCSIESAIGEIFFLDAPGGTGKTFLLNLLLAKVRQSKNIALAVASSGIAATLLTGGRTAHSAFKLPFDLVRQ